MYVLFSTNIVPPHHSTPHPPHANPHRPNYKQIFDNLIENNVVHDLYAYRGSAGDDPEVPPYTGVNVGNLWE